MKGYLTEMVRKKEEKGQKLVCEVFFSGCKKPLSADENIPCKDKYEDNATRHKFSRALFILEWNMLKRYSEMLYSASRCSLLLGHNLTSMLHFFIKVEAK